MFYSKVVLFAISLGAFSVLATPHALHHHALHRRAVAARAVAARVASMPSFIANSSDVTVRRQNSAKCIDRSNNPSSSSSSSIPAATPIAPNGPAVIPPVQNTPPVTPTPTPTPTPSPTPHQQQPPPPATTSTTPPASQPPSSDNGPFTGGDGTFFDTGLGACGKTNTDADFIVAVSKERFDAVSTGNPNSNPLCGRQVSISFGGHTATATVVDRCEACAYNSLDMTPKLFQQFADLGVGRIHDIVWSFIS